MSFQENVQQWVLLDNQIRIYNEKIKTLRDKKQELTDNLLEEAGRKGYKESVIHITDGKLKFANTKVTTSLTFKYVEDVLTSCIKDENIKNELVKRLKDNREVKYVEELKRYNTK